jgi:hypothetical protein
MMPSPRLIPKPLRMVVEPNSGIPQVAWRDGQT